MRLVVNYCYIINALCTSQETKKVYIKTPNLHSNFDNEEFKKKK